MEVFEQSCKDFEKEMFASGYHIYNDHTKFAYDVTLARANLLQNRNERWTLKVCKPYPHLPDPPPIISTLLYPVIRLSPRPRAFLVSPLAQRLQLYESHATPKLYACSAKYSAHGKPEEVNVCAPIGSSFDTAFDAFKMFFKLKTGQCWNERLNKSKIGNELFSYTAPKQGEPRGCEEGWEGAIEVV